MRHPEGDTLCTVKACVLKFACEGHARVNLHARNCEEQDLDTRNCSEREAEGDSLRAKSYVRGTEACKNLNTRHCEKFSVRDMV